MRGKRGAGHNRGMKFALTLGYWGAQPPANHGELIQAADEAGFDAVYTAESWGSDAFTPLAWYGSQTKNIKLGTAITQMSARNPTNPRWRRPLWPVWFSDRPGQQVPRSMIRTGSSPTATK